MSHQVDDRDPTRRSVADVRSELGLTVQELARLAGIPERILRLIERRHYTPSPEQIDRLCAALGTTRDALDLGVPGTRPGLYGTGGTFM